MTCEACRTIPPSLPAEYTAKGRYEEIAGVKTYVTGSADATIGVLGVYDIFGLAIQTLQGADYLASLLNAIVILPDFFHGDAVQAAWFPPDTDEKRALVTKFISTKAALPLNSELLKTVINSTKTTFSSVTKWGAYGLCWGGKLVVINSGPESSFTASAQAHPGRLENVDAENLTIPHIVLASKDEPAEIVEHYSQILSKSATGGYVETYSSMWHGWMGARAKLDDEHANAEYARGYHQLGNFFKKNLQ